MTINERIRFLRKEHLKINQTEFALLIGMKQTSVSSFEKNGATVTDQTIKSICFAVDGLNEKWLRYGDEPIFLKTSTKTLEQLKKEFNLDEFAFGFVSEYLKLDKEKRNLFQNFFYNVLNYTNKSTDNTKEESSDGIEPTSIEERVAKAEEEYIKSDLNLVRKRELLALNSTLDTQNIKQKNTNNFINKNKVI